MSHKRALEAGALRHLVEPLDPAAAPPECRDTPGYIARLLEDYHLRVTAASARHPRNPRQSLHSISTSHNGSQPGALQAPVSPMDTLADTALSTSPTFAPASRRASQAGSPGRKPSHWSPSQHARQTIVGDCARDPYGDRPTKRARSEALPSPFQNAVNSRPASSHNPSVGLQHNVEQGVYNAERKRQLSQAERDILEFMEGLKAQRREGNPSPWLSEQPFPLPILEELHAHANGEVPPPSKAQLGQPLEDVASSGTALRAFQSAMEEQAPAEQSAIMDSPNDAESAIRDPSVRTTQTHTPPEEKPPSPVPADHGLLKSDEAPIKSNANSSKSGLGGRRRASKGVEQQKDGQTLDAPQQLESPQSLLVDFHEGRQPESISQATESHTGSPLDLGLLPRPRSALGHLDPREPVTLSPAAETRSSSVPPTIHMVIYPTTTEPEVVRRRPGRPRKLRQDTICAACHFSPNALTGEPESWLQCNGCKKWFHFACAGIKNEREVRNIDKFHCKECTPKFGKTTHVRKSARAHNSVDYAKLTEGIVQTSDDTPEHHYINPIKSGEIEFTPETFPRMPAELITAEYFQKCRAMTEPVVIPAALNPRPQFPGSDEDAAPILDSVEEDSKMADAFIDTELPAERVSDIGQDGIGMVIPQGLTVRRVAELYGLHEKLAVIDVKSQEGEDKRWTLAKWADYYEDDSDDKPVRNVISLEVSRSRLGRLIKRPQVVRDLDLADSVWPTEDGPPPKVQFYVLMSVADCYTDFHIDFGGSSVYYHILKGKKTFFFIPPTTANLKHYENWCKSPAQNYCWLGNQTKECYRVDLSEGDTMLIPSGWIHAVWTPETSLVIGGNFLTRLHYTNQIKVAEIEKNTKVALKFRYPFFQKVMWSTVLQYLEQDPLPSYVEAVLMEGGQFPREKPIWQEYNKFGHNSDPGPEYYNARYYPQAELEGLPDLVSYIFRTVMIMLGRVEGVTAEAITAVTRSIPKRGNPLENARRFAMWVAWKRGNEQIPEWAHPDAVLPERPEAEDKAKKLSVAALKKLERAKHIEMYHTINADHRSRRSNNASRSGSPGSTNGARLPYASPKNSVLGPKRSACDACRKRRVGCKHKEAVRDASMVNGQRQFEFVAPSAKASVNGKDGVVDGIAIDPALEGIPGTPRALVTVEIPARVPPPAPLEPETPQETVSVTPSRPEPTVPTATPISAGGSRNKACANCRKSKRKCLHDENGNLDPVKVAESKQPRTSAKKRPNNSTGEASGKRIKHEQPSATENVLEDNVIHINGTLPAYTEQVEPQLPAPVAPMTVMTGGAVMADPAASISSFRQALLGMQGGSSEQRLHMMNGYSGDMSVNDHPPPAFDNFAHPLEEDPAVGPTEPLSPIGLVDQPEPAEMLANGTDEAEVPVDPHLEAMAVEQPVPAAQPTAASPENRTRSTSPMSELSDVPPSSPTEIQTTIEEPGSAAEVKDEAVARDMRGMSGASAETGVDDESARLAKELQSQEFGLRMRSMRSK